MNLCYKYVRIYTI